MFPPRAYPGHNGLVLKNRSQVVAVWSSVHMLSHRQTNQHIELSLGKFQILCVVHAWVEIVPSGTHISTSDIHMFLLKLC